MYLARNLWIGIASLFCAHVYAANQAETTVPARIVTHYALTSSLNHPGHDPTAWRLLGSNDDGKTWALLDLRTNYFFDSGMERRIFRTCVQTPFNMLRLVVDDVNMPRTGNYNLDVSVQLTEIEFMGPLVGAKTEGDLQPIITSSKEHPVQGPAENAFDNDTATRWWDYGINTPGGCWIQCRYSLRSESLITNAAQIQLAARLAETRNAVFEKGGHILSNLNANLPEFRRSLSGYAITSANDATERDPRNWRLMGSNDNGTSWDTLDIRSNELFGARFQRRQFNLTNQTAYSLYQLQIDAARVPNSEFQVSEIEPIYTAHEAKRRFSTVVQCRADNPPMESVEMAFDGDPKTKWFTYFWIKTNLPIWVQWHYVPEEEGLPVISQHQIDRLSEQIRVSNLTSQITNVVRNLKGYAISSAFDEPDRDPCDWKLLGSSNEGKDWTVVDTRRGETFTSRLQRRVFLLTNQAVFPLYRLQFDHVANPSMANSIQVGEIEPLWADRSATNHITLVVSTRGDNPPSETIDKAFDGNPQSKWLDFAEDSTNKESWVQWYCATGCEHSVVDLDRLPVIRPWSKRHVCLNMEGIVVGSTSNTIGLLDETGFERVVLRSSIGEVVPGQRIRLEGVLQFTNEAPHVLNPTLTRLDTLPELALGSPPALTGMSPRFYIGTIEGTAASISRQRDYSTIRLASENGGGDVTIRILNPNVSLRSFLDCRLRVRGIVEPVLDESGQWAPGIIWVDKADDICLAPSGDTPQTVSSAPSSPPDASSPLGNFREIRDRLSDPSMNDFPVHIRGVITYIDMGLGEFYIQNNTGSLCILGQFNAGLSPFSKQEGLFVELTGQAHQGAVYSTEFIHVLGKAKMPEPLRHSWDYLMTGKDDGKWIEIEGVVRAVEQQRITLTVSGGQLVVWINELDRNSISILLGSQVRACGVCSPIVNNNNQRLGLRLLAPYGECVQVISATPEDPFDLPQTPISQVMQIDQTRSLKNGQMTKTTGIITYQEPHMIFIQEGTNGLRVTLRQQIQAEAGDYVEVVGLAEPDGFSPKLVQAIVRKIHKMELPAAPPLDLINGSLNGEEENRDATRGQIEGTLVGLAANDSVRILELRHAQMNHTFYAYIPGREPLPSLPLGSRVRFQGVFKAKRDSVPDFGDVMTSFEMYIHSPEAIQVLERPAWWTARHTFWVLGVCGSVLTLSLAWVGLLRNRVRQRTQELKREIQQHEITEAKLEAEIVERKKMEIQIQESHKNLLTASRQAGMAEVATSVLHNVGNVLNSVNVSASLLNERTRESKIPFLAKAVDLLREHEHDLGDFLTSDPKGKHLPDFLGQLAVHLASEQTTTIEELQGLMKNIAHIKDIVSMQQSYASISGLTEVVKIRDMVDDSLRMNASALARHNVQLTLDFAPDLPPITVDKHKVLQILNNLIRNAKHACQDSVRTDKRLNITATHAQNRIIISVTDNGVGIPPENLTRIFNHGFTTRKTGHGFGLHSGALTAKEIGGSLDVTSAGTGLGATFTLELPLAPPQRETA